MIFYGKCKVPRRDFSEMSTSSAELHLNVFVFPDLKMFTAIFWRAFWVGKQNTEFCSTEFLKLPRFFLLDFVSAYSKAETLLCQQRSV